MKKLIWMSGFLTAVSLFLCLFPVQEAMAKTVTENMICAGAGEALAGVNSSRNNLPTAGIASVKTATDAIGTALDADGDGTIAGYYNLGVAHVDNSLNIREKPDEKSKLVGKMNKNAGCEIMGSSGEWYHIRSGKVEGYVKSEFIYSGADAIKVALEKMVLMAHVRTTTLFVRAEANTDSAILTMVPIDEELEVLEGKASDDWVKIAIDEDQGWISTEFVSISEQLDKAATVQELKIGQGVSSVRVSLVNYSKQFLGNPYVWGGTSLTKGCDCSGYVQQIFRKFGISLPRTSRQQALCGTKVAASEARPGDLFFYSKYGTINHVAIYIGGGQVINASNPRSGIKISNAYYRTPAAVRRVLKD